MEKHSIRVDRLVVVYDELDLPWLALRIKPKGSAAGHNGMKSVIGSLGTSDLVRVRMGIHPGRPIARWRGFCAGADQALANEGIGGIRRLCSRRGSFHNRRGRRKGHDEIQSSRPRLKYRGSMRIYEELFIVKPDAPEEEVDAFVEQLRTQLTTAGATVDKVDKWGKRRLAYRVDKYREGIYVLFQFTAGPGDGEGTGAPVARVGRGAEVPDRAHRRDAEAPRQAEEGTRQARGQAARPQAPATPAPAQPSLAQQMTEGPAPAAMPGPAEGRSISHGGITEEDQAAPHSGPPAATRPSPPRRSSISGARKCAGSASRRSTISITRT